MNYYMKQVILCAGLFFLLLRPNFANTNDVIQSIESQSNSIKSVYSASELSGFKDRAQKNKLAYQSFIHSFAEKSKEKNSLANVKKDVDGAVLFISFSMPDELILTLADEASTYHMPLVVKGLIDNDFKKTVDYFFKLNQLAKKRHMNFEGIAIDPLWFSQFDIKKVPALVVTKRMHDCKPQSLCKDQLFDVIYGNVHIKDGLGAIKNKGDMSYLASTILEQGYV